MVSLCLVIVANILTHAYSLSFPFIYGSLTIKKFLGLMLPNLLISFFMVCAFCFLLRNALTPYSNKDIVPCFL